MLLATQPQISKKANQTSQCLKFCYLWKDRLRCAPARQRADYICLELDWPRARAYTRCPPLTYCCIGQLYGRKSDGCGSSGWKWLNCEDKVVRRRTGLLSEQQAAQPPSLGPGAETLMNPQDEAIEEPSEKHAVWLRSWHSQVSSVFSQVEFVTEDRGGADEHKGPGDLTLLMVRQELAAYYI